MLSFYIFLGREGRKDITVSMWIVGVLLISMELLYVAGLRGLIPGSGGVSLTLQLKPPLFPKQSRVQYKVGCFIRWVK
jgi:hypothetical protein